MPHIELRNDGWFEAGKDSEKTFPMAYLIYESKQKLKKALRKIGEAPSIQALEQTLSKIPEQFQFRGHPYLTGKHVMIRTPGLPGECYLGDLLENKK